MRLDGAAPAKSTHPRGQAWVGFFLVLTVLAAAAVTLEVWYNVRQQLTPEALAAAQLLWQEKGPADYDLKYLVSYQSRDGERLAGRVVDGLPTDVEVNGERLSPLLYPLHDLTPLVEATTAEGRVTAVAPPTSRVVFEVRVRGGQAVAGSANGRPLPWEWTGLYDMDGLFAGIGRLLEQDKNSGAWRPYVVATFDRKDGHLIHFVHSRMQARERVEIQVGELTPPAQAPASR